MAIEPEGAVDYDECGAGPTLVLLPGSCSTGAAWRPVIAGWNGEFRCIRTSLLGYGGTTERRTAEDLSISHEAGAVESIVRRAGGPVHLVGHSFGGPSGAGGKPPGKLANSLRSPGPLPRRPCSRRHAASG